jgi:integrin beta 3
VELPPPVGRLAAARPIVEQALDRRSPLRQQVREARRLRLIILASLTVVLLAALPAIFLIRDAAGDPVFAGLDSLSVPGWADQSHQDLASGNRWCFQSCRLRERTWRSAKAAADTDTVYEQALASAGWHPWHSAGCPTSVGKYSCWQRDEYALDLWTRDAPCDLANVAPAPGTSPSSLDPSANPVPTPDGSQAPATCSGSLVTAKVANLGDPNWHR